MRQMAQRFRAGGDDRWLPRPPTQRGRSGRRAAIEDIRVSVPERGLRHDLRAVSIVWRRELIRFRGDRLRAITALSSRSCSCSCSAPGSGRWRATAPRPEFNFKTFIYPGVLAMSVLFTAIFSAASIVWDREFGFLREILVAPVSRGSIVIGKCLGGATIATFQGIIFLALAGFAGVPYNPVLIITLIGELLLLSFTLTAFGVMMAARIKQFQAFMALTQMLVMPLFFLSGALYPLSGLPTWLTVLTRIDPLTYIVGPDAARGVQPPGHARGVRTAPVADHYLGGLAGPAGPVARDGGRDGRGHDGDRDRRVQQDRVTNAGKKESDAGWLRGQTTRRRIHRRSDGGPERRQRCPGGGPEHRQTCYT